MKTYTSAAVPSTAALRVPPWSNSGVAMTLTPNPCCWAMLTEASRDVESTTLTETTWRLASRARARAAAASFQTAPPLYTGTTTSTRKVFASGAVPAMSDSGLVIEEALPHRHGNDLKVEPQRPVVDVPEVVLHPLLHLFKRIGLAAQAI